MDAPQWNGEDWRDWPRVEDHPSEAYFRMAAAMGDEASVRLRCQHDEQPATAQHYAVLAAGYYHEIGRAHV